MVWSWPIVPLLNGVELTIVPLLDGVELGYCSSVEWCGTDLLFLFYMVWSWPIVPLLDGVELAYCSSVGWC